MGLGIPSLKIKIVLESNPLKSSMLVGGLGVLQFHQRYVQKKTLNCQTTYLARGGEIFNASLKFHVVFEIVVGEFVVN